MPTDFRDAWLAVSPYGKSRHLAASGFAALSRSQRVEVTTMTAAAIVCSAVIAGATMQTVAPRVAARREFVGMIDAPVAASPWLRPVPASASVDAARVRTLPAIGGHLMPARATAGQGRGVSAPAPHRSSRFTVRLVRFFLPFTRHRQPSGGSTAE